MMDRLKLPNEHKLVFENYFTNQKIDTNYYPIYFIPCKQVDGTVIPHTRFALYFLLDKIVSFKTGQDYFRNPYEKPNYKLPQSFESAVSMGYTFETLCDSTDLINEKVLLDSAAGWATEQGFPDLIVGYKNTDTDEFVQDLYLKDFFKNKTYNILDYYMHITFKDLYLNEEVLDLKVDELSHSIINNLSFDLFRSDIVEMVHKLKLSCLEGSFNNSYAEEYREMNDEIVMILSRFIKNYSSERDYNKLLELCSYLRGLDVVEFYTTQNNDKYVSLNDLLKNGNKDRYFDNVVIAFHPRLKEILSDKFN